LCRILVHANDSVLYNKRIQLIRALSKNLAILSVPVFKDLSDTTNLFNYYKEIESKYFFPPFISSEFRIRLSLVYLHRMVQDPGIDSFKIFYPDPTKDTIASVKELSGYLNNTLIAYIDMYYDNWEMFYFAFKEGSDQLIYLIEAGGDSNRYRQKKQFLNSLYIKVKPKNIQ
jgi:hypothetical protein